MLDKLTKVNKDAAVHATRLVTGKTATDLVMSKLVKRLPFFSRMFQSGRIKDNEIARFGVAQATLALQQQFAPDNEKLSYAAEAMVEHAMADVVLSSKVFNDISAELEKLIP